MILKRLVKLKQTQIERKNNELFMNKKWREQFEKLISLLIPLSLVYQLSQSPQDAETLTDQHKC